MSDNKQNDDFYDDVLEDSFEDDFADDFADDFSDNLPDDDFVDSAIDEPEYAEEPFDDDFSDNDFQSEDGSDEDWGEGGFDDDEPAAGGEKKSKFNLSFNTIVIGLAVLLGLGIFGFQLTKSKPTNAPTDRYQSSLSLQGATEGTVFGEQAPETVVQQPNTSQETPKEDNSGGQGFLYETESLDAVKVELDDTPPMPTPVVAEERPFIQEELPILSQTEVPRPPIDDIVINEEVVVNDPVEEIIMPRQEDQSNLLIDVDDEVEVQPMVIETQPELVSIEEIPFVVEDVSQEVVMEEVITPRQIVSSTATDDLILQKLESIVGRLDNMEAEISRVNASAKNRVQALERQVQTLRSSSARSSSNTVSNVAPRAQQPSKPVVPKQAASSRSVGAAWELRAAQPGKAWVSQKGQKSLKPVVVGDSLNGIGRITAILYQSNKWIIQGTKGQIRQ